LLTCGRNFLLLGEHCVPQCGVPIFFLRMAEFAPLGSFVFAVLRGGFFYVPFFPMGIHSFAFSIPTASASSFFPPFSSRVSGRVSFFETFGPPTLSSAAPYRIFVFFMYPLSLSLFPFFTILSFPPNCLPSPLTPCQFLLFFFHTPPSTLFLGPCLCFFLLGRAACVFYFLPPKSKAGVPCNLRL